MGAFSYYHIQDAGSMGESTTSCGYPPQHSGHFSRFEVFFSDMRSSSFPQALKLGSWQHIVLKGHMATDTELAYTPVSQAYGHHSY